MMMKKKLGRDDAPFTHMDDIAMMSDDEIYRCVRELENGRRSNRDPYSWEVELAYFHRELGVRADQRAAHAAWLKAGGDDGGPVGASADEETYEAN